MRLLLRVLLSGYYLLMMLEFSILWFLQTWGWEKENQVQPEEDFLNVEVEGRRGTSAGNVFCGNHASNRLVMTLRSLESLRWWCLQMRWTITQWGASSSWVNSFWDQMVERNSHVTDESFPPDLSWRNIGMHVSVPLASESPMRWPDVIFMYRFTSDATLH